MQRHYVVIEGNIGAGKTTLAQSLSVDLGGSLLLETFEDNAALKDFYAAVTEQEKNKLAFANELHFLVARYHQMLRHFKKTSPQQLTLSDYLPQKSLLFAKLNLSETEYELYEKNYHTLFQNMPEPSLVIYLEKSVDTLLQQIKGRGRLYENQIAPLYLEKINAAYAALLVELPTTTKVIVLKETDLISQSRISVIENILKIVQS